MPLWKVVCIYPGAFPRREENTRLGLSFEAACDCARLLNHGDFTSAQTTKGGVFCWYEAREMTPLEEIRWKWVHKERG